MKFRENCNLLAGAIGVAMLFFYLLPLVAPAAKLNLAVNYREAQEMARQYLQSLGYNTEGFAEYGSLGIDNQQECFLQAHSASNEDRERIDRHRSTAYWEVMYRQPHSDQRTHLTLSP